MQVPRNRTTPPRAPAERDPPPAGEGEVSALVLATHRARGLPTKATNLVASKNEGRRSAGRRDCPVGPRHAADVAIHLRFGRRPRVQRDALASRRSTAALSEVSRPRLFDFRPGFLGRGSSRALPALSCPSPAAAPRAPAVIPVDMMPEAARERTVSVRARAPRPLCAIRSTLMMASLRSAGGGLKGKYGWRRQAQARSGSASSV